MFCAGSINLICVPIGCFISGAVTQPLGRKRSMMALNLPFFTVWLLYYNATDVITLYIALIISGLAGGLHEAPVIFQSNVIDFELIYKYTYMSVTLQ